MRHLLLVPVVLLTLAGCGNKGALYLPEPEAQPAPATTTEAAAKPQQSETHAATPAP